MPVALPLFEPELYHGSGPAYFGTLTRISPGEPPKNKCYPVPAMLDWLHAVKGAKSDTYISQGQFERDLRRIATLQSIGLVWADIDNKHLARYEERGAVSFMLGVINDLGFPLPSLILASGNGYHIKWLFDNPLYRDDLLRWDAVEKAITAALRDIGADRGAIDAARVLRVAETTNLKNGFVAHVAWVNYVRGEPIRYAFDDLYHEMMPTPRIITPEEDARLNRAPKPHKRAATGFSKYNAATLAFGRLNDVRTVVRGRNWTRHSGGVPEGYRDTVLFVCAVGLSYVCPRHSWWNEMQCLASEFCPSLSRKEWEHFMRPTYNRFVSSVTNGNESRYRITNAYIIDRLNITADEQTRLKIILSPDLARERKRESDLRNKATVRRSEEKRSAKKQRNQEIERLHAEGKPMRYIAKEVGASLNTVCRVLQVSRCLQ